MTIAQKLIVACLVKNEIKPLSNLLKEWLDPKEKVAYHFVMDYYKEHGELPAPEIFADKYKVDITEAKGRANFYLKEVKNRYIATTLGAQIPKIMSELKSDPDESIKNLQNTLTSLKLKVSDTNFLLTSDETEKRFQEYRDRVLTGGITHLSTGIEAIDKATYGYKTEDLITIGGPGAMGKTWLLLKMAMALELDLAAKSAEHGEILIISNEMPAEELNERMDCIRFGLPYSEFMEGKLPRGLLRRYKEGLEHLKICKSRIRIVDRLMYVDDIYSLIGIYKPCKIFIDGSYLFLSQKDGWEKIVEITQGMKRIAKDTKTPITNTTQLKKGTSKGSSKKTSFESQDDFAYGPSYTQDSDIAYVMYQDLDMVFDFEIGVKIIKGRRVKPNTKFIFTNNLVTMDQTIRLDSDELEKPKVEW